ncbi:MAG: hypothetical protein LBQ76_09800 [Candidatus Fibromonas sp.]|nr:hypothetical protein [Candidatus Fibromonas sp.]
MDKPQKRRKKTRSNIYKQLESELSQKDLEAMKASAIDFFLKDIEALKQFTKKMQEDFEQSDLTFALKMFVLSNNKVFNMVEYMKGQSRLAEEYVKSQNKDFNSDERRAALNHWIEKNAALYRKSTIFEQIYCIDKMSEEIVPVIAKAIET